jgi:hypothetical protein
MGYCWRAQMEGNTYCLFSSSKLTLREELGSLQQSMREVMGVVK